MHPEWSTQRLTTTVEFTGVGVHSGEPCRLRVGPGNGRGCRVEQAGEEFSAHVDSVVELERCTVLGRGAARLSTVEHLFSALAALRVYDCRVEVLEGQEVPILDGSALPFWEALRGVVEPGPELEPLVVREPTWVGNDQSQVLALPADDCELQYALYYAHPLIGYQEVSFRPRRDRFEEQLAPARTFALQQEVEWLKAKGLARGGSLENALVIGESYSSSLRLPLEPVRHKCLDLLGDLYLAGRPIQGRVLAVKAGHRWHVELVQKLSAGREVSGNAG